MREKQFSFSKVGTSYIQDSNQELNGWVLAKNRDGLVGRLTGVSLQSIIIGRKKSQVL